MHKRWSSGGRKNQNTRRKRVFELSSLWLENHSLGRDIEGKLPTIVQLSRNQPGFPMKCREFRVGKDHLWNFREIPELEREAWTFYSANKKYKLFHCFFLLIWKQLTQGEIDLRAATSDFLCFIRLDRVLRRITFFVLVLSALTKRLDSENIQWVKGLEIFFLSNLFAWAPEEWRIRFFMKIDN